MLGWKDKVIPHINVEDSWQELQSIAEQATLAAVNAAQTGKSSERAIGQLEGFSHAIAMIAKHTDKNIHAILESANLIGNMITDTEAGAWSSLHKEARSSLAIGRRLNNIAEEQLLSGYEVEELGDMALEKAEHAQKTLQLTDEYHKLNRRVVKLINKIGNDHLRAIPR